jgi:N-acetylmuramoyl-L-alanine amidase
MVQEALRKSTLSRINMKIALIAGHDKYKKQGAVAYGVSENEFWREFIQDLLPLLPKKHTYKVFERPNQTVYGYRKAVRVLHKAIDAWGAELDVEFHFNAASNFSVRGHSVLYYKYSHKGKFYAALLNDKYTKYLPSKNRGLKPVNRNDRGGYQLAVGRSVSLLSEAFFGHSELHNYQRAGRYRNSLLKAVVEFFDEV